MHASFFSLRFLIILSILSFPGITQSQVCTGSLGDPVVNITFGQGASGPTSYAPPLDYTYTSSTCPNDGYYTITNATVGCYGNNWHTVTSDHTGKGNFMLINASYEPGDFFVTTVSDLCPNTTYEFSSWILNVLAVAGIRPDIIFYIEKPDGTVLASFDTGPIYISSSPEWKKYGVLFTTPADNATVVLRMRNNSPGGNGNDLALDDIAFRPCGAKVTAAIQGNTDTVDICETDTSTQFTFSGDISSEYQSPLYQWQISTNEGNTWQDIPGATTTSYLRLPASTPGAYWYRLTVVEDIFATIPSCRIASNLLIINVHALPVVDAGPDRVYIEGYPVTINATASGEDISYNWVPDIYLTNDSTLNPVATPPVDMMYTLQVKSAFNCAVKGSMKIKSVKGLFVPNAFTPNGDGTNDYWRIPYLDENLEADVKIFNRWGQLIYHTSTVPVSWDGKVNSIPQPAGTYIYSISFKNNSMLPLKGTITLIR